MIFVTGGVASGKKTWVRSLGYGEDEFSKELGSTHPVLCGIEQLELLDADLNAVVRSAVGKEVVIATELGCGVVPVTREDALRRERAGRLACAFAAEADTVVRLVAGIPVALKGDIPAAR